MPPLAREAGLAVDDHGRMLVDTTLRSLSHPDVHSVGDALHISLGQRDGIVQLGMDEDSRVLTGRLAAIVKERVALRGSVFGLRHPSLAVSGAKRY